MAISMKTPQTGLATFSSSSPEDVTITAVDQSKAFIRITWRTQESGPDDAAIEAQFTSDTNIRLTKASSGNDVNVEWQVIEFTSGSNISVDAYRETGIGDGSTTTISLSDVADAYVVASWQADESGFANKSFIIPEITSTTVLTYHQDGNEIHAITSYVIESSDQIVEQVSVTNPATIEFDTTIDTRVLAQSFVSGFSNNIADDNDFRLLCKTKFQSTTLLRCNTIANDNKNYLFYIVELPDTWETHWGELNLISTASGDITVTSYDVDKSWLQPSSGDQFPTGTSTEPSDATHGTFHTYEIGSSTTVTITSYNGSDNTVNGVWVVEEVGAVGGSVHPWFYRIGFNRQ